MAERLTQEQHHRPSGGPVRRVTIPSDDSLFREHVRWCAERYPHDEPGQLERRLRQLFPRVVVRSRGLSGEPPTWYVYRDGEWRPPVARWWGAPLVAHVVLSGDGYLVETNPAARSLLGIPEGQRRHFTEFVAPDAMESATHVFETVMAGQTLTATLVLRPLGGEPFNCEVHARHMGSMLHGWLRMADGVAVRPVSARPELPELQTDPDDDLVFAAYARDLLAALTDPTPEDLALRMRALYPRTRVTAIDGGHWLVRRDAAPIPSDRGSDWWLDPELPRVWYDDRALIIAANAAARDLLGDPLVGRHWQEIVTPGTQQDVQPVLDMIRAMGEAVSRFRIPAADGRLVEFDSHTCVDGGWFETTMRPTDASRLEADV